MAGLVNLALTVVMWNYSPVAAQNTPRNSPVQQPTTAATQPAAKPAETRKLSIKSYLSIDKPTQVSVGFSPINLGRINQTDETFDVSGFFASNLARPTPSI
jgi:hypothetical protein